MTNLGARLIKMVDSAILQGAFDDSDDSKALNSAMFQGAFDDSNNISTLLATTNTGSNYMVVLKVGPATRVETEERIYTCREADVTINGEHQVGERIMAGYEFGTRTLLVIDAESGRHIRRSSTIRQFTLAE